MLPVIRVLEKGSRKHGCRIGWTFAGSEIVVCVSANPGHSACWSEGMRAKIRSLSPSSRPRPKLLGKSNAFIVPAKMTNPLWMKVGP